MKTYQTRKTYLVFVSIVSAFFIILAGCGGGSGDGGGSNPSTWPVTTGSGAVDLGSAANFVILSKTGITSVPPSAITGNIGTSPNTGASMVLTCGEMTGIIYSVDAAGPACIVTDPVRLTAAVSDMETAYTNAAGRTGTDGTELYAGNLTGQNFPPGLYKWSSDVSVNAANTVTLTGTATDTWIFQIAGDLTMNPGSSVTLAGGALAKNVFWQIGGGTGVLLDTTVAFQGNILAVKGITMNALASVTGRLLSQTLVALNANPVTAP